MKVLFVCMANIGRSQVAEVYFNQLTEQHQAASAGISVSFLGKDKIKNYPYHRSIEYIQEKIGIDISEKETVQLTLKLCKEYDQVIMIMERWLDIYYTGKITHWDIPDTPGQDKETTWKIWDQVMKNVEELVKEIG